MLIFPKEILSSTNEKHFSMFSRSSVVIYVIIISVCIAFGALLPVIRVDLSVQSRGVIRSVKESNTLFSPITNQVVRVGIMENQHVRRGDTLIWFNREKLDESLSSIKYRHSEMKSFISDLESILDYKYGELISTRFKGEHAQYRQQLRDFDLQIRHDEQEYIRAKLLFDKEVIPKLEFESKEFLYKQKLEAKSLYIYQKRSEWQTVLSQSRIDISSIESEIKQNKLQENLYALVAGIDGYVVGFQGVVAGDMVFANQQIASLVPTTDLIVESYVSSGDIGFLHNGMKAKFQVDAYNYNDWGLATGEIVDISNQPIQNEGSYYFKVKCSLDQKSLTLKSGCTGPLKNGLTLTSRYTIAKRSLFQLLYDKADDWMNPKLLLNKTYKQ